MRDPILKTPKLIIFLLATIMLSGGISVIDSLLAQNRKKEEVKESFRRPAPTQPIKPTIPSANRYQEDKVFLEQADSLFRPPMDFEERQIVKGNVIFRQGGMWMYCDSAYYFPERNSLDAFGHVEMRQGDTLFVYADKLFYNGGERHAVLTSGPSRSEVMMKDPKMTLTTDSLDYDLNLELGWYTQGGRLFDEVNNLTSVYGEYSPATKNAKFQNNVILVNNKDGYTMYTEELDYNTDTHIANINTATRIEGANDTILTSSGRYNTVTDNAVLTSRSTIIHKDSADNVVTLEGDSIIYDKATHISRAYMFRNKIRNPQPMVLTDTARKMTLIGGYGEYNDSLQEAYSTEYPLLIEYSRPDSLFLRADTILTYLRVEYVWPDTLSHNWDTSVRNRLKGYRNAQDLADDLHINLPVLPYNFQKPGTSGELYGFALEFFSRLSEQKAAREKALQQAGTQVQPNLPILKVSDENPAAEIDSGMMLPNENLNIEEKESDIKGSTELAVNSSVEESPDDDEIQEEISEEEIGDSEPGEADSYSQRGVNSEEKIKIPRLDALGRDSTHMIPKEFHVARAVGRARFFNQQLQGVADTLIFHEYDSTLYMIKKPIVWNEDRQVYGGRIDVHFNDSTVDRAYLPETGFLAEYIDEDFYNQLSGKIMTATFENGDLKRLDVEGNVETIFLPMENDSTYNKLVHVESSYMTMDMTARKLDKLKFWPETTGTMTGLFMVKRSQQYLPGFKWFEILRPQREWYGDRWKWMDALGEVPEALDAYFREDAPASKSKIAPSAESLINPPKDISKELSLEKQEKQKDLIEEIEKFETQEVEEVTETSMEEKKGSGED